MSNNNYRSCIFVGASDSGKSTLLGHLLLQAGCISHERAEEVRELCDAQNRSIFRYSWLLDTGVDERKHASTIDVKTRRLPIDDCEYTILDVPGNWKYRNKILAAMTAIDVVVLVVSAAYGDCEESDEHQTTFLLLAFTSGIKNLIVVVNKMDETVPAYSEDRFIEIKTNLLTKIQRVGYRANTVAWIATSALEGLNLTESSESLSWAEKSTLLDALKSIRRPPRPLDRSVRVAIRESFPAKQGESGVLAIGVVLAGTICSGVQIKLSTSDGKRFYTASSIEIHGQKVESASPGQQIGIMVKGASIDVCHSGTIISEVRGDLFRSLPRLEVQVIMLSDVKLKNQSCPLFVCATGRSPCKVFLESTIDRRSGKMIKKNPEFLARNDAGVIAIEPRCHFPAEPFAYYPSLGRLVVMENKTIIAVGVVKRLVE